MRVSLVAARLGRHDCDEKEVVRLDLNGFGRPLHWTWKDELAMHRFSIRRFHSALLLVLLLLQQVRRCFGCCSFLVRAIPR